MTILKNIKQAIVKRTHNVTVELGIRCGSEAQAKEIASAILTAANDILSDTNSNLLKKWKYAAIRNEVTRPNDEIKQAHKEG